MPHPVPPNQLVSDSPLLIRECIQELASLVKSSNVSVECGAVVITISKGTYWFSMYKTFEPGSRVDNKEATAALDEFMDVSLYLSDEWGAGLGFLNNLVEIPVPLIVRVHLEADLDFLFDGPGLDGFDEVLNGDW